MTRAVAHPDKPYLTSQKTIDIDNREASVAQMKLNNSISKDPDLPTSARRVNQLALKRITANSESNRAVQQVERTTGIYNRVGLTNNYNKAMEIVDSTDVNDYVHLSRNSAEAEHVVNIQEAPGFFNGPNPMPNRRTRVDVQGEDDGPADLANFTLANNAHITLEGRYAQVMTRLGQAADERILIKHGPPVNGDFANLNFGSFAAHGEVQMSQRDLFSWTEVYAQDAVEAISRLGADFSEVKTGLMEAVSEVQLSTEALATRLIDDSALNELDDGDFVHYNGAPWQEVLDY